MKILSNIKIDSVDSLENYNDLEKKDLRNIFYGMSRLYESVARLHYAYNGIKTSENNFPYIPTNFIDLQTIICFLKLNKINSKSFLDIGCGNGLVINVFSCFFSFMDTSNNKIHGIDLNPSITNKKIKKIDAFKYKNYNQHDVIYLYNPINKSIIMYDLLKLIIDKIAKDTIIIFNNTGLTKIQLTELNFKPLKENHDRIVFYKKY